MSDEEWEHWKIAPGSHGFLWVEQRINRCIAIGWNDLGNLDKYKNEDMIRKKFKKFYPHNRPKQLIDFYYDVKEGHKIVASSGRYIYGVGEISGKYIHNEYLFYEHSKPVTWYFTFWEPLDIYELNLTEELQNKLNRQRTVLGLYEEEWDKIYKIVKKLKTPFKDLQNWRGLSRSPQTEQEVIILFSKLTDSLKMRIEYVSTRFPDAYIMVKERNDWVSYPVEFEIYSSSFKSHGHLEKMKKIGLDECMIICREDDWEKIPKYIKVIELRKELLKLL